MPFSYHPPTRNQCRVCQELITVAGAEPLVDNGNGKASSANNWAFHNWYNFVLGYSPDFPDFILDKQELSRTDLVVDPFMGSGTTLVCCKLRGITSQGLDANDFMVAAARTKLRWDLDTSGLRRRANELLGAIAEAFEKYSWQEEHSVTGTQASLWGYGGRNQQGYRHYAHDHRPSMLLAKYISDKPFAKAKTIDAVIQAAFNGGLEKEFFQLALDSILLPISNVRYGPGFGIIKPTEDVDVLGFFARKVERMIRDLESVDDTQRSTLAEAILGDARKLTCYLRSESASLMITSPPYPGDHEYTKHTRLELIFRGYATNKHEFKAIKTRMLQASTTNIYREIDDTGPVLGMESIGTVTHLIEERLQHDGATSGFEKLYTRLVWGYFGGMHKTLEQCFRILKPGGKIALLVSDSHAFKMVHIQTAKILQEIGDKLGFVNPEILLWQFKTSTSHKYNLRENILVLTKPKDA